MDNSHYWRRKEEMKKKALEHTKEMSNTYSEEILNSINNTTLYFMNGNNVKKSHHEGDSIITETVYPLVKNAMVRPIPKHHVLQSTSTQAIFDELSNNGKVCVLNFASYKNAGGGFLKGSTAQEECLCHDSFLYNVLKEYPKYYEWNKQHLNKGMYLHRALYTKDVIFEFEDKKALVDVITCASPNYSVALKYGGFTAKENLTCLKQRAKFIHAIIEDNPQIDVVILGAWGCGVFKQQPKQMAEIWKRLPFDSNLTIIHAIPDRRTFNDFENVLHKHK